MIITASIVLFNENPEVLEQTISSFLNIKFNKKLYLINNHPSINYSQYENHKDIEYINTKINLGFGRGHNLVLNKIESEFHLVLNPDVGFSEEVIKTLLNVLKSKEDLTFITPKVLYPSGKEQVVCRKKPSFSNLLKRFIHKDSEYNSHKLSKPFQPDFIHGCFMLFKTNYFKDLKGFDERFFLYMEDADICRRIIHTKLKFLYYPEVSIIHHLGKGSSKNLKLFFIHTSSAIKYFLKWGF